MSRQHIIDKIQKLLALANSDNENEAKMAAARAQSLLTKYNLTMSEIGESSEDKYSSEVINTGRLRQDPAWKYVQSLLREFFFVEIVSTKVPRADDSSKVFWKEPKKVHCYLIFGQPHNVAIARHVGDFLMRAFSDLFTQYRKDTGASLAARSSYYLGLFKGLHEQLKRSRQEVEVETGLVVVQDADLEEFVRDSLSGKIKTVQTRTTGVADSHALNAGYEKGKTMAIAKGLGGGQNNKQVGNILKIGGRT